MWALRLWESKARSVMPEGVALGAASLAGIPDSGPGVQAYPVRSVRPLGQETWQAYMQGALSYRQRRQVLRSLMPMLSGAQQSSASKGLRKALEGALKGVPEPHEVWLRLSRIR
ncbi:MAG: hypothetical protein R3F17_08350 [Planctomycetota bacterium]